AAEAEALLRAPASSPSAAPGGAGPRAEPIIRAPHAHAARTEAAELAGPSARFRFRPSAPEGDAEHGSELAPDGVADGDPAAPVAVERDDAERDPLEPRTDDPGELDLGEAVL